MIFASLRFDDAVHVKPHELILTDEGLFGVAWQTKVERKRRGTKFVVPMSASLTLDGCLLSFDRDYWMRDLNTRDAFRDVAAAYQRSVQWLRQGEEQAIKLAESKLHGLRRSARVTLLDAAVHAGRSTEEIGLQANWKNPDPLLLKYTRNRTSVPAQMVQQLVKDMVDHSHPFEVPADAVLDDGAVSEIRTRNEQIAQKSGLSKNAEDLLRVVTIDQPDRQFREESSSGSSDQRKKFGTFSAALLEALTNHRQLWNDARSSGELDKFKQAATSAPTTPPKKRARSTSPPSPPSTAKAKKNSNGVLAKEFNFSRPKQF
ncbi:unnamed protein product [Cladocopium goreaui]|uniref:Uncharacterized protein n=1 Tax=Cladocopium goreaui TaxID=2562237 RepID=A0A9P1FMN8_9DINO|nr:unnamed protein product [Cladocopium goreaui]